MVPYIGLHRHKELPHIGCLAVVDVGHEPLNIGKRRGIHLAKAAIGNGGFEHGIGIRIGSRSVGIRIKECLRGVVVTEAAVEAVEQPSGRHRRTVAVRRAVCQ